MPFWSIGKNLLKTQEKVKQKLLLVPNCGKTAIFERLIARGSFQ